MKAIGELYRAAREEKGWNIDDVCQKTKIHHTIIEAIEEGTIQEKFSPVYIKGFLKKYAQVLGMDVTAILEEFEKKIPAQSQPQMLVVEPQKYSFNVKYIVSIIVIIIALILISTMGISMLKKHKFEPFKIKISRLLPDARQKPQVARKNTLTLLVPEKETLKLTISAMREVWLQVKADDKVVFVGVLKPQTSETWLAERGYSVWTGKAEGLLVNLNGHDLGSPGKGVLKNIIINREGMKTN